MPISPTAPGGPNGAATTDGRAVDDAGPATLDGRMSKLAISWSAAVLVEFAPLAEPSAAVTHTSATKPASTIRCPGQMRLIRRARKPAAAVSTRS